MTKPTGKKRGRPRKLPEFMVRLGEDKERWRKWLSSMGLPEHSSSPKEVLEHRLPDVVDKDGKRSRPRIGERGGDRSLTLQNEHWYVFPSGDDKRGVLPSNWLRYLEYMGVVAEHLSPRDNGSVIKRLAHEDARSRSSSPPPHFPEELGTPSQFKERLTGHELELRLKADRRNHVLRFRFHQLPPDEDEDLDPADEPAGHWEGLKFIPE